jgi:hypothetical protein
MTAGIQFSNSHVVSIEFVIASASEAIQLRCGETEGWIASSLSLLAMTAKHTSAFPRRDASGFCKNLRPKEGVGNAGRAMHPQPRVCVKNKHTS